MKHVNETSLSRVWSHTKNQRPYAIITAFRGEYTYEENVSRNKELAAYFRENGYGFFYIDGYWIENQGTPREKLVKEDSIFVVGPKENERIFLIRMINLADIYDQEGVLVKTSNGINIYNKTGKIVHQLNSLVPGQLGQIYSQLRNRRQGKFTFTEERDDLGWIDRLAGINKQ